MQLELKTVSEQVTVSTALSMDALQWRRNAAREYAYAYRPGEAGSIKCALNCLKWAMEAERLREDIYQAQGWLGLNA